MSDVAPQIRRSLEASSAAMSRAAGGDVALIARAAESIADRLLAGGTLFVFGNGGSATDAEHFAAEILGRYARDRRPLAAHALTADSATVTAIGNDYGFDEVFARQVRGLAKSQDVCVGISTSGKSANVVKGLQASRDAGALTVSLIGQAGTPVAAVSDIALTVAEENTARIQEVHRAIIHAICDVIESRL